MRTAGIVNVRMIAFMNMEEGNVGGFTCLCGSSGLAEKSSARGVMISSETLEILEAPFEWPGTDDAVSPEYCGLLNMILVTKKAWIAGSYPLSLFNTFEPGDIDIFLQDESVKYVVELLYEYGYKRDLGAYHVNGGKYPTDVHEVFLFEHSEWPLINLVVGAYECLEDVWKEFDLSVCEIGIAYDAEEGCLVLACSPTHVETMVKGVVQVDLGSGVPEVLQRRIWKYTDRGWQKYLLGGTGGTGGTLYEIRVTNDGFVGTWAGSPDWIVILDNLPPLTIE